MSKKDAKGMKKKPRPQKGKFSKKGGHIITSKLSEGGETIEKRQQRDG